MRRPFLIFSEESSGIATRKSQSFLGWKDGKIEDELTELNEILHVLHSAHVLRRQSPKQLVQSRNIQEAPTKTEKDSDWKALVEQPRLEDSRSDGSSRHFYHSSAVSLEDESRQPSSTKSYSTDARCQRLPAALPFQRRYWKLALHRLDDRETESQHSRRCISSQSYSSSDTSTLCSISVSSGRQPALGEGNGEPRESFGKRDVNFIEQKKKPRLQNRRKQQVTLHSMPCQVRAHSQKC